MIICFPQMESAFLAYVSLLSSLPLYCSKFNSVDSVYSHINVIYVTALLYRRFLEHVLEALWLQESRI